MQNRFVGDIGDFGKYGLLRALCDPSDGDRPLKLGVVWYLTPNGTDGAGQRTEYLEPTPGNHACYRDCAPDVYDALAEIVRPRDSEKRNVVAVRKAGILPAAVFHECRLDFTGIASNDRLARENHREQYVSAAQEATAHCNLVFVDPDTGIPPARVSRTRERGLAYSYLDELERYVQNDQSLVVYQQYPRIPEPCWLKQKADQLERQLALRGTRGHPFALLYASRAFLIAPAAAHDNLLRKRAAAMVEGPWKWLFSSAGL